jgi:hypothetical protein
MLMNSMTAPAAKDAAISWRMLYCLAQPYSMLQPPCCSHLLLLLLLLASAAPAANAPLPSPAEAGAMASAALKGVLAPPAKK